MQNQTTQITTTDGTPLKVSLRRAERKNKIRAFLFVVPTLSLILFAFLIPIFDMLFLSVHAPEVVDLLPKTVKALKNWDESGGLPGESAFAALAAELIKLRKDRTLGHVTLRLNYEKAGMRSLLNKTARKVRRLKAGPFKEKMIAIESDWGNREPWVIIKRMGKRFTSTHYLSAFDLKYSVDDEIISKPQVQRIHNRIWLRTLWVSLAVTALCLILGYPVSYLLSTLPVRISNLLMICVLLPFWTSLLVRLTSWIVLLQKQGVLNDIFVWLGFVADEHRVRMVYNMTGTLVAMTHILLPFMILPLYSVMKTISPYYVKAARSLGANSFRAFRQIYLPLTIPGIGAGGLLVFILAIGYYITPALVGGATGQLIGNFIALHMSKTLNWGLAAAMGSILLAGVLAIYWLYNRIVGIENMKLG
ncbi:MAG: ABC transporter permease [Desulfobacterales bacterium]|jgi:putative spermidine/putrescine transport system permease protein